jgi:ribosomal protein S27AE
MAGDSGGRVAQVADDHRVSPVPAADQRIERRIGRDDEGDVRMPETHLSCPCGDTEPMTRPSGRVVCGRCLGPVRAIPPVMSRF